MMQCPLCQSPRHNKRIWNKHYLMWFDMQWGLCPKHPRAFRDDCVECGRSSAK